LSSIPAFDIIIAGAGIVGLATAWQLIERSPQLRIAILEKERGPARHQSSRNSGVIHSGIYYKPGSAKADNCLRGYRMLLDFADHHNIPYRICGKFIAATQESELPLLRGIFSNGVAHGMQGLNMLDEKASRSAEPNVAAISSIWVPQAGIIDFGQVCITLMRRLQDRGAILYFDHRVEGLEIYHDRVQVATPYGSFAGGMFINCCGLYADRVAMLSGMWGKYRILPFRGEFYTLTSDAARLIRHMVYPVPDPRFPFLGVHFTPRMDDTVEVGPNAVLAFAREGYKFSTVNPGELSEILLYQGFYRMALRYWTRGLSEMHRSLSKKAFVQSVQRLVPAIGMASLKSGRSGVRAQCVGTDGMMLYDYLILESGRVINLINAPSPAATSALSVGDLIAAKALANYR
jgi:(S)-2-hydroxyglutarate dehydrogenase